MLNAHSFKIGLADTNICENCDKNTQESSLHYLIVCPHFTEQRRTLFDQVEQTFIPRFRKLTQKRQYEILVEGFDPENLELRKFNTKIMKFTQDFILSSKRFDEKPPPALPLRLSLLIYLNLYQFPFSQEILHILYQCIAMSSTSSDGELFF